MDYLYWEEYELPGLSVSKTRSQPNPRIETDVFDGPLRVELRMAPDAVPATFDCSLQCRDQIETTMVGAFFDMVNTQSSMLFYKDLPTEYGMQKHLVRISGGIPQPDASSTTRNEMMKYSFTLYVEKIIKPDAIINNPELVLRWGRSASKLDIIVNVELPEVQVED